MDYFSEFFIELSYLGLFLSSFLAATILPLSSELVLAALLLEDFSASSLIFIATLGNVLGSLLNYYVAYWAGFRFFRRYLKVSDLALEKAHHRFKKYGLFSLLFAWVPVIGDPITIIAGLLRVPFIYFVVLVTLGKFFRYTLLTLGLSSL